MNDKELSTETSFICSNSYESHLKKNLMKDIWRIIEENQKNGYTIKLPSPPKILDTSAWISGLNW